MLEKVSYKDIARFTWYYWRQQKGRLPILLAGTGCAAFLDTLFPVVTGRLVKALNDADIQTWQDNFLSHPVFIFFVLMIAVDTFYHLLRNAVIYLWNNFANRNLANIVQDGFAKVQRFSTDWHANSFGGATVRKITRGMWSFDTYEDILYLYLYPTAIIMIFTIIIMALHWPIMGLITFVMAALYVSVSIWTVVVINAPRFKAGANEDTKVGAAVADSITANATVKAFGREDYEDGRLKMVVDSWRYIALNSWQVANTTDLLRRLVSVLMMAVMVGSSIYLWQQGKADTGDVVYVFTSFIVLSAYLRHIGEQIANMQRAMSEMEDIVWYWKTGIAVQDKPDAETFIPGEGKITFDQVRFAYGNQDAPIYDDFSIRIEPGEKVALVGYSGSGKSTFVKLIQRLYDIQGGEIRIDGQNVADVTQASLRKAIALVPQEPILFHRSLADNIAYGKPEASRDEIIAAAKKAYAHEFIEKLPQGYETLVGERGIKLSGGERQRVAIARAILADAPILILDEATSSLDSVSEHYIQKALENLVKGKTTITIAHRLSTIKDVDRILVFDQGRVIEQGTHGELLRREDAHYKHLYDMQAMDLIGDL